MSHTPPGWYSEEDSRHCYWDGGQWDERVTRAPLDVDPQPIPGETHIFAGVRDLPTEPRPHDFAARVRRLIPGHRST